jgi:hypothetical protein
MDADNNLLVGLHTFARKQDENFTTVAFAHLLRRFSRISPKITVHILNRILNDRVKVTEEDCPALSISTHRQIPEGIPDLTIEVRKDLAVVIEVKVGAEPNCDQLERYRIYLANLEASRKCLVLLTRDPVTHECCELVDQHILWHEIAEIIEAAVGYVPNPITSYVGEQFVDFMKAEGMTMEQITGELIGGFRSLMGLRAMLKEAINKCGLKTNRGDFIQEKDGYAGFYIDIGPTHCAAGIYLEKPDLLRFEVSRRSMGTQLEQGWDTLGELDLGGTGFFLQPVGVQRERIQRFVRDQCDSRRVNG